MRPGSPSLPSFLSVAALAVLTLAVSAGTLQAAAINDLYRLKTELSALDEQVYLEDLVMQRVKYAVECLDYDEAPLELAGNSVELTYDFEDVTAVFRFADREYERHYHYDLDTKTLQIVGDNDK